MNDASDPSVIGRWEETQHSRWDEPLDFAETDDLPLVRIEFQRCKINGDGFVILVGGNAIWTEPQV